MKTWVDKKAPWNTKKFVPYFNQSLGITIESPEHLRKLEKEGTIFMDIQEHERELKRIKNEVKTKRTEELSNNIQNKLTQIKWGRSFYTEQKRSGF